MRLRSLDTAGDVREDRRRRPGSVEGTMRHLRFLHYVDSVARLGSIRKAATRLNVASSALNRRILDLEDELGVPLFERTARGVRLTAAGELFVSYIRRTSKDLARLRSDIQGLGGLCRGVVRISTIEAVAHSFLPAELTTFHSAYPQITYAVNVSSADQVVTAVTEGEADIGLTFNPAPNVQFQVLRRVHQRLCALMSREHSLAARKNLRLSDCLAYPLAIPVRMLGGRRLLDAAMVDSGLLLNPVLEADNFEVMKQFVETTGGIALEMEIGALPDIAAGRLAMVPLLGRHLSGSLVLGVRLNRGLPAGAALFCERLVQRFDTMTGQSAQPPVPEPGSERDAVTASL